MVEYSTYQNLIRHFSNLVLDDSRKDVTFSFEGSKRKIKAHKVILEAASPVFKKLLSGKITEVIITDTSPEIFEILVNGIYLNPISFEADDMESVVDLYHAARKFKIQDILNLAYSFMINNCHEDNTHLLLLTSKVSQLPELESICLSFFKEHTYLTLARHLVLSIDDDVMSHFLSLDCLSIKDEFELYIALEIMVQMKKLTKYSKCLSQIRFLTMESSEILRCDLLSDQEKCHVITNIEILKHFKSSKVPMPAHLSTETKRRESEKGFKIFSRQFFWTVVLLSSPEYEKYLNPFYKLMDIAENRREHVVNLIKGMKQVNEKGTLNWNKLHAISAKLFEINKK